MFVENRTKYYNRVTVFDKVKGIEWKGPYHFPTLEGALSAAQSDFLNSEGVTKVEVFEWGVTKPIALYEK